MFKVVGHVRFANVVAKRLTVHIQKLTHFFGGQSKQFSDAYDFGLDLLVG